MKSLRICALGVVLMLGACSVIPEPESVQLYRLGPLNISSDDRATASSVTIPLTIRVNEPLAEHALDSVRLSVYQSERRQAYWQGVRFSDRVPLLVQNAIADALQDSQRFNAVFTDKVAALADLELVLQLNDFALHTQSQGYQARVSIRASVIERNGRVVRSSFVANGFHDIRATNAEQAIEGLNRALTEAYLQLEGWLTSELQ